MQLECKLEINAAAKAKIFAYWTNEAKRKLWEDDLEYLAFDGAVKTGGGGVMKLSGKPEMRFTIIEAVEGKTYSDRYELTFGTLIFRHAFVTEKDKCHITHSVELKNSLTDEGDLGFLSSVFADFPATTLKLKRLLEE
jgi:hypothetical protein